MNGTRLYELIYALAATDGREAALFGDCAPLAREAFAQSFVGSSFPELWFELPLAGDPWFDLHVGAKHGDLDEVTSFGEGSCGGAPEAFAWFAAQGPAARQLFLSWDVSSGDMEAPAVQLLRGTRDTELVCDFLTVAGRADAAPAYRLFEERLPEGWFACYVGVFPRRREPFLRVECIPRIRQQHAYAKDPALLAEHLRSIGFEGMGPTLLDRCQSLARIPFRLEFQFDVTPEGTAGRTFGASVRFASPPGSEAWASFDAEGAAGELMRQVEAWGLADDRWRLLPGTMFAKRARMAGESCMLWCRPTFLKLRWRDGEPLDAKAYLVAGVQP